MPSLRVSSRNERGFQVVRSAVAFRERVLLAQDCPWGNVLYVDGIDGSDSYNGRSSDRAKKTIQGAIDVATGGDTIYIRPLTFDDDKGFNRYTEDVVITSGIASGTFVNAGISLIGITRPGATGDFLGVRWTQETLTALTNDAPALALENIGFFSEGATYGVHLVHDGAAGLKQGSQGTSLYNCALKGKGLYVLSGGDGLTVEKTRFQCAWNGVVAQLNYSASLNPGRRLTVRNCEWLDGNGVVSSAACIVIAPPCTEVLIRDSYFPQEPTGGCYISAAGANEGLVANCHFANANMVLATHILWGDAMLPAGIYDQLGLVVA